jgi:DNA-binding transcriptional regulator PaaX
MNSSRGKAIEGVVQSAASDVWTFLTNHAHVLVCIAKDPEIRLRDVANAVGITERAVQKIVLELQTAGIILKKRVGRRNQYEIQWSAPLRHPIEAHRTVGDLIALVTGTSM